LIALLKNNEKPEWWKGNHKICYRLFNKIIETTCSLEDNQEERVKRIIQHPEGSCTVILQFYKEHEQASVGDDCL
jgi:hypothetical protein